MSSLSAPLFSDNSPTLIYWVAYKSVGVNPSLPTYSSSAWVWLATPFVL